MKSGLVFIVILLMTVRSVEAQMPYIDSLKNEINSSADDTTRLLLFEKITGFYSEVNPDSAYYYAGKMLAITKKLDLRIEEIAALGEMGYALLNLGNYPQSLQTLLTGISLAEDPNSEKNVLTVDFPPADDYTDRSVSAGMQRLARLGRIQQIAGILYGNSGNFQKAIAYYETAIPLAAQSNNFRVMSITYATLGRAYLSLNRPDSALFNLQKAYDYAIRADYRRYLGSVLLNIGRVYLAMGKQDTAKKYFLNALAESDTHNYYRGIVACNLALADMYKHSNKPDSVLYYVHKGLTIAYPLNAPDLFLRSYTALADFYGKKGISDSTVKYQSLIIKINDSLFNSKQAQQFQNIDYNAQQQQQGILAAQKEYQNRLQKYLLLGGLTVFLLAAVFLFRSNRHREKTNTTLKRQNEEIETAMAHLKTTQAQLIQSEKMASLGELTTGIAHEIQNPLNFVNNFSEVNKELLMEMKDEINRGNLEEVKSIAGDIIENEQKIIYHGKRADAIVKGMLHHSRASSEKKEPADLNAIVDEYLRLSYQSLQAKEDSFRATIHSSLDPAVGVINIISQDIGRVLLNMYNNAFYAMSEKKKQSPVTFESLISVSTRRLNNKVEIRVKDNGNGIPQKVIDKIFQPFFTTKPTGQGTGLGLSMSYDIIKAHGGELSVESKEGNGAEFIVQIPAV
jgi:two-component system, NtrC family, sensor kinase